MKQKQWVRITVIFFAWMIVLTIFSRAAASVTKARVTVTKATRQTISHEIRLDGTVEAKDHFLQYVPSGLMIKSVKVSPGQHVESGDVLFTVDTQKLQEKIGEIEEEIASAKQREDISISRAEKAYQDVKLNAEEEKALAYSAYTKAVNAYNEYIDTHEVFDNTEISDSEGTEDKVFDDSYYNESAARELESAVESAQSAYDMVVREQDKLVEAAANSLQQTKEDLGLERDTRDLENCLEELQPYLQNEGQYLAEHPGVMDRVFVESGMETTAGVAVLIADSAEGVRFWAAFSGEYREDITETSMITLRGESLGGGEESYVVSDVTISKNNTSEPGVSDEYSLTSNIPGDLYPVGSSVSVIIDNKSEEYDTCIPLSSLRQNGNYQYFIYVTEEQDTVLGKEMVAKEMIVTVLDKNEKYAAIEENVSGDVIESASKNITDGSRVMIIE